VRKTLTLLAALATCLVPAAALSAQPADTLIWGGPVYTAEDTSPKVEAVAVTNGKISYAGTRAGAGALRGPRTQIIDLKGAALFPGFTDRHVHLGGIGERELTLNLGGSGSAAGVVCRLQAARRARAPRVAGPRGGGRVAGRVPLWRWGGAGRLRAPVALGGRQERMRSTAVAS